MTDVLRYAAFSQHPAGGAAVGVVLDAGGLDVESMQQLAAEIGLAETVFLFPVGDDDFVARYFSPERELSCCGHATIAAAVAHAERRGPGAMTLYTRSGRVEVATRATGSGGLAATSTSVSTRVVKISAEDLTTILGALGCTANDLDPSLPPWVSYAGAWHPVIALRDRERLTALRPDTAGLRALMGRRDWATVNLVWRASERSFHCRNVFSPDGGVEDPATGAASAALGGYLRALAVLPLPATVAVFQVGQRGRVSQLSVHVPASVRDGISVSGHAVALAAVSPSGWRSAGARELVGV